MIDAGEAIHYPITGGPREAVARLFFSSLELMSQTPVREIVPLMFVEDIARSAAFYREKLGFAVVLDWSPDGKLAWCRLERGSAAIMLQQACPDEDGPAAGRGRGVGFFFSCDNADALFAELTAAGLDIRPPLTSFYGMHQLFLNDPDGYELCFQSPA